jgi:GTP-binding protein
MKAELQVERLDFSKTSFFLSASTLNQCPIDEADEVAFVGRSNAGKSSAINSLTDQPKLARTSKTPGRTQLLNFFQVAEGKFLVDLPGFGYAKVPPAVKAKWQKQLESYLRERKSLRGLVLLMDCRHPLKDFDRLMIEWCSQAPMSVHILLTKCDKLKSGARKKVLLETRRELAEYGELITIQLFSALKHEGGGELKGRLQSWLCPKEKIVEELA